MATLPPDIKAVGNAEEPRVRPTLLELLSAFMRMSVISVGGGTIAWARQIIVRQRGWMTDDEFLQARALSQILPGPNMLNFAVSVGSHFRGASGAAICLFGLTAIPLVIVMTLGIVYFSIGFVPSAKAVLSGLAAAAAGTSFGTALSTGAKHFREAIFVLLTAFVFITVGLYRWPMIPVALGTSAVSLIVYWPRKGGDKRT